MAAAAGVAAASVPVSEGAGQGEGEAGEAGGDLGVKARPEQEDQPGVPIPVRVVAQPQRVPPGHCLLAESEEVIRIPVVRQAACACKTNVSRLNRG